MKPYGVNEIRREYINFFKERNHTALKSFSLIPDGDKSLLLINAGMAPLKLYFLGQKHMPNNRATTSQRCIRTADIDVVGKTHRHATFFEMLGNFSFGNYFKKEAITWAWEFLTKVIELEEDRISVSIYKDDEEAYKYWKEVSTITDDRIYRLDKEDNFWELDQGPCGPCTEIFYDRGEEFGTGTGPSDNSDRFMEIWNLVFTQFNKKSDGTYEPLEHPNIDTGMGLERMALVCQKANNIFELETFKPILNKIELLAGVKYGTDEKKDESIRVILDHSKALTFLISDGVLPSNEGRGYVLRRLLRRASRHGKLLGINDKFLNNIVDSVVEVYKEEYTELLENIDRIKKIVDLEEERFSKTIDQGLVILSEFIDKHIKESSLMLSGKEAFLLYDTYGFPLDLTVEILSDKGLDVDKEEFSKLMLEQKTRAREGRKGDAGWSENNSFNFSELVQTKFLGYETTNSQAKVLSIIKDDKEVDKLEENESGIVVLDQTPFYAESGGPVGDIGKFVSETAEVSVFDTQKTNGVFIHYVDVTTGCLSVGDNIEAIVDENRRNDIRRNHSATHLLQKALIMVLGEHVRQAGSYVDDKKLRFDFTHFEPVTKEQLFEIEAIVNNAIFKSYPVNAEYMNIEEAKSKGATALFNEKYGNTVRVLSMGDFSIELCGGIHVNNTSEVQMFKITTEQGVAAGVRRIEAITARECYRDYLKLNNKISLMSSKLKTNNSDLLLKLDKLINDNKELLREVESLKSKIMNASSSSISNEFEQIGDILLLSRKIDNCDMKELREFADNLKEKKNNYVIVLGSEKSGKVSFIACVDKELNKKGIKAGDLVKKVAIHTGGNGGGRPDFASAGGKDASKIEEALLLVKEMIK